MTSPATRSESPPSSARQGRKPPRSPYPSATPERTRAGAGRSAWRALRHRGFAAYFLGSLASNLGTWFQNTAQVLLTYRLTHSVFAVGVVTCAQFSGSLLLGPWAAVVADRVGGKRMLIATQLASAALAAALACLQAAGLLGEMLLVSGALGLGLAFTFALPVQTALVPRLVTEADTEAALAMNSVSYNAGRALAPALCVLLITNLGFVWAFALNAVSFAVFAAALLRAHPLTPRRVGLPARARDGFSVALQQPRIMLMLAMVAAVTFADDPILILGPGLARGVFGVSSDWAGYFLSALGLGTLLGSLRPVRDPRSWDAKRTSRRAAKSLLLLVAAIVVFALGLDKWVSLGMAFLAGAAALWTGAVTQTQLVRQEPALTASVMALWAIAWAGVKPLASLADGWLATSLPWSGGNHLWVAAAVLCAPALLVGSAEILLGRRPREAMRMRGRRLAARLDDRLYRRRASGGQPAGGQPAGAGR